MSRALVFEPEAEAEIAQAADWYEQHSLTARVGFLRALDKSIDFIIHNPEQYQIAYGRTRRAVVDGYPFALFYIVTERAVIVLACIHAARNPDVWP